MFDLVIVGGGPAGATLAWALRHSQLKIAIIDKARFPRDKACAGWVTPAVMQALDIDLTDYVRGRTLQPVAGFAIGQLGGRPLHCRYPGKPVSYAIRRIEFDEYLLQRSQAMLLTGRPVESIQRSAAGWCVNDAIETRLLVGAGGHFCPVAKLSGLRAGSESVVAAQEMEFEMTERQARLCPVEPDMPELFFSRDFKGYGWLLRKGNFLNIGLGREDSRTLPRQVRDFVDELSLRQWLDGAIPAGFKGHAYLLYPRSRRRLFDDNLLLIGDAAGLAHAHSGEGIRPAVESALLAAQVIATSRGDYSVRHLQAYAGLLEQRFGRRAHEAKSDLVPQALKSRLAAQLLKTDWFTRHIVAERWFMHAGQAPLSWYGQTP
jgi:flavin-dependent dehydrogenase